jgi:hypothetical protein
MSVRAVWKKGNVYSLKLRDDLYTLCQMANGHSKVFFFEIFRATDEWNGVDLNQVPILFSWGCGRVVTQKLGVRKISEKEAKPTTAAVERLRIYPTLNNDGYRLYGEYPWKGGNLVDCGEDARLSGFQAPVVVENLTVKENRDLILKYEFDGVAGDNHVRERLLRYVDEGINIDVGKFYVFPELEIPGFKKPVYVKPA